MPQFCHRPSQYLQCRQSTVINNALNIMQQPSACSLLISWRRGNISLKGCSWRPSWMTSPIGQQAPSGKRGACATRLLWTAQPQVAYRPLYTLSVPLKLWLPFVMFLRLLKAYCFSFDPGLSLVLPVLHFSINSSWLDLYFGINSSWLDLYFGINSSWLDL